MKIFIKKLWLFIVVITLIIAVTACQNQNMDDRSSNSPSIGTPTVKASTAPEDTLSTPAVTMDVSESNDEDTPAIDENAPIEEQIVFSNTLTKSTLGTFMVLGEVKNNSSKAISFTFKINYYDVNETLLGSSIGAVNDLNSKNTKLFTALSIEDFSNADHYKIEVDNVIETAEIMKDLVEISDVKVMNTSGLHSIEGKLKNMDSKSHSFTLAIGLYNTEHQLIDIANAAVNDLLPGKNTIFTGLGSSSKIKEAKEIKVYLDTIIE